MPTPPPFQPGDLSPDVFLRRYWNRHPCVLRGWLPHPPAALGLPYLLQLAADESAAARRVQGSVRVDHWSVDYGPFEQSSPALPARDWTLLVQDVDKYHPTAAALLDTFAFLPRWMIDDIMVSHAAPGGSVGPHVDRYDVFLVQIGGTRRWQLATTFDPAPDTRFELALLRPFDPEYTHLAAPGDIVYIPAGVAHHGVAEDACETWSVGLRTPAASELLDALAGWAADRPDADARRLAVARPDPRVPAAITDAMVAAARRLLADMIEADDDTFAVFLGETLTGYRPWSGTLPADETAPTGTLHLNDWAKIAWRAPDRLFVNGDSRRVPPAAGQALCVRRALPPDWIEDFGDRQEAQALLAWLRDLDALAPGHDRRETS